MNYRRKRTTLPFTVVMMILLFVTTMTLFIMERPEIRVVKQFYEYEQEQEFWHSYELFHPHMQELFSRNNYIDQRGHIFVDHFDVDSYELEVGSSRKINEWHMSDAHEPLTNVYEVPVTKTYQSRFGEFSILQNVYAVKETDGWRVLWNYDYEQEAEE